MAIHLTDDGTTDTVFRCDQCTQEFRFNYTNDTLPIHEGMHEDDRSDYESWVQECIEEIEAEHECALAFDEGAEGEHAARELGELDEYEEEDDL